MIARLIVGAVCAVAASSALAQAWTWDAVIPSGANTIEYVTGGMKVSNGPGTGSMFLGRTFGAPAGGSTLANAANVTENMRLGVGGSTIDVAARRAIPWARMANAAALVGGAAWAGFQVGAPISKALGGDAITIGPMRCAATNTGWQCDEGDATTVSVEKWCASVGVSALGTVSFCGPTNIGAAMQLVANINALPDSRFNSFREVFMTPFVDSTFPGRVVYPWKRKEFNTGVTGPTVFEYSRVSLQFPNVQGCPAFIDALNPAFSRGAGESLPGPDGKCPTGRYNVVPPEVFAGRLTQYGDPTVGPTLGPDIIGKGQPITGTEPGEITGPASKPGSPTVTTTTNPDGSPGPVTTKTPTTNYSYGPQTINYTTTVVTTVNNAGNVTTTTTTENPNPDPQDPCVKNPDTLGCSKFGTLPTDAPMWQNKTVPFAVEDLGFSGACPAPVTWHVFGIELKWSYQPICDVAPMIRLALLAMAAVGAIGIIIKETSK